MKWLDEIRIEELPEPYNEMAELIGIEATIKLAEYFAKQGIYFRSLDNLVSEKKKQYIIKYFNGANHRELARETGFSIQYVYQIIKEHKIKVRMPSLL